MSSPLYMLDTNTVSFLIKGHQSVRSKIIHTPMHTLAISAITEAELRRGVAKKPEATRLAQLVHEFLIRVNIFSWDSNAAVSYAKLRATCDKKGKTLGTMDMLIAAHALSINAILITNDRAFFNLEYGGLEIEDWVSESHS